MPIKVVISPWSGKGLVQISKTLYKQLGTKKAGLVIHQPPGGQRYEVVHYTHERNLPSGKTGLKGPIRYLAKD
jgi:hypothetical protein